MTAVVAGLGSALPPAVAQEDLWSGYFRAHYGDSRKARMAFRRSGVQRRHGVVDPRVEDLSQWGTGARMRRFLEEALPLGKEALSGALDAAGLDAERVQQLTVVSCTGYATPGLDLLLARDLGLLPDAQRLCVGHMGCHAAIPALAGLADTVSARGRIGALLCLELTTLHVQPAGDDLEQMVAHALFADAAAATVVRPDGPGLEVVEVVTRTAHAHAELMTWDVTDTGFRMGLSPQVPVVLREHVADVVAELLVRHDLQVTDVAGWAVHPGGPRILDVVADRLHLAEGALAHSRAVLREAGNCSSATVLLILQRLLIQERPRPGAPLIAMAFGPGLTLAAALLRVKA